MVQKFTYPKKKRQDFSKLYTEQEKAKYEYNTNPFFKNFVECWNEQCKDVLGISLVELYNAYSKRAGVQLKLGF